MFNFFHLKTLRCKSVQLLPFNVHMIYKDVKIGRIPPLLQHTSIGFSPIFIIFMSDSPMVRLIISYLLLSFRFHLECTIKCLEPCIHRTSFQQRHKCAKRPTKYFVVFHFNIRSRNLLHQRSSTRAETGAKGEEEAHTQTHKSRVMEVAERVSWQVS